MAIPPTFTSPAPDFERLRADLLLVRQKGLKLLRRLDLPGLTQAARALDRVDQDDPVGPAVLHQVVRDAIAELDGWEATALAKLYGLEAGYGHQTPAVNRRDVADSLRLSYDYYRTAKEPGLLDELAEVILRQIEDHHARLAFLAMSRRQPTASRLAVKWIERFEAYYRVWTPISALGGNLTAYRSTLLETDRPYDRQPNPDIEADDGYSQEEQACGYATTAWQNFACYLSAVRDFVRSHGGHWVLSDGQAERDVADAVYRIAHASPYNTRDDSVLQLAHDLRICNDEKRLLDLADTTQQEEHLFLRGAAGEPLLMALHEDWQDWAARCRCTWPAGQKLERAYFATSRHYPDIDPSCAMHTMISACNDYLLILDEDWARVADWYRMDYRPRPGVTGEELYDPRDIVLSGDRPSNSPRQELTK